MCNIWEHCWWVENAAIVSLLIVFGPYGWGMWKLMRRKPDTNAGIFWLYMSFGLLAASILAIVIGMAIENS